MSAGVTELIIKNTSVGSEYLQITYTFQKHDRITIDQDKQKITLTRNGTEYNISGDATGDWLKLQVDTAFEVTDEETGEKSTEYTSNAFNFVVSDKYKSIRAEISFNQYYF